MFSLIRDFFLQFLNPLAFVGVVLFITLFLIKKKPNTAIWFVVICLLVIAIFGNPYFSTFLTRSMEWRNMPSQAMTNADAILLIADGTFVSETHDNVLRWVTKPMACSTVRHISNKSLLL